MYKQIAHFYFLMLLAVGLIASYSFNSPYFALITTLLISISIMFFNKLSPASPLVWFVFFINIYHLSIALLVYIGQRDVYALDKIIYANILALIGFIFSSLFFVKRRENFEYVKPLAFSGRSIKILFLMLLILSLIVPFEFMRSGATNKAEFNDSLGSVYNILIFVFALYLLKYKRISQAKWPILLFSIYLVLCTLLLGERNIFFSYAIMLIIISYAKYKLGKKYIILSVLVLILLIPVFGVYKNLFTRSDFSTGNNNSLLVTLANGEFRSAGYNLDVIFANNVSFKFGSTIPNDITRALIPGMLYMSENSIAWYNNTFHPEIVASGRGYGFSFAAEGYINFSWPGISIWFFFLGLFMNYLYHKSMRSQVALAVYSVLIPIFIYSLRGDISTILSPLIKQIFSVLVVVYLLDFLLSKKQNPDSLIVNGKN